MSKPTLLLLHGALGSAAQLTPLAEGLSTTFTIINRNFYGHGGSAIPPAGYQMEELVSELEDWMDHHLSAPVLAFGYSMGGYAATVLASRRPEFFTRIITLGTKWTWTPASAAREVGMLNTNMIAEKVPALANLIAQRHSPQDWKAVVQATIPLLTALGEDPLIDESGLAKLDLPVDILWGSADRMVSREESEHMANCLPKGRFFMLDGIKHPIEQIDPQVLHPFFD